MTYTKAAQRRQGIHVPATEDDTATSRRYRTLPTLVSVIAITSVPIVANVGSVALLILTVIASLGLLLVLKSRQSFSFVQVATVALPITFYSLGPMRVNLSLADAFLLLAAVTALATYKPWQGKRSRNAALIFGGALCIQIAIWASLVAATFQGTLHTLAEGAFGAFKLVLAISYCGFFAVCVRNEVRQRDHRALYIWADAAAASALVGIVATVAYGMGIDLGMTIAFRATGTFEDPNAYATYLLISAGLSCFASHLRFSRPWNWQLVPIATAVLLTGSRAAIVALTVALLITAVVFGRRSAVIRRVAFPGGLFAGTTLFLIAGESTKAALSRGLSITDSTAEGTDIRFDLWRIAISLWEQYPFFGIGLGQFRTVSVEQFGANYGQLAHNTYLSVLAETGLVGILAFSIIPILIAVRTLSMVRQDQTGAWSFIAFSVLAVAVEAATLNLENFRPVWAFFGLILAMGFREITQGRGVRTPTILTSRP